MCSTKTGGSPNDSKYNRLEEITTLLTMVTEAKNLHISLLCFDEETEQYRGKIQA